MISANIFVYFAVKQINCWNSLSQGNVTEFTGSQQNLHKQAVVSYSACIHFGQLCCQKSYQDHFLFQGYHVFSWFKKKIELPVFDVALLSVWIVDLKYKQRGHALSIGIVRCAACVCNIFVALVNDLALKWNKYNWLRMPTFSFNLRVFTSTLIERWRNCHALFWMHILLRLWPIDITRSRPSLWPSVTETHALDWGQLRVCFDMCFELCFYCFMMTLSKES